MSKYNLEVTIDGDYRVDVTLLRQAIAAVLGAHDCQTGSGVSVRVTDDDAVQVLNRTYRDTDKPTDVLSFPAELPPLPPDMPLEDEMLHLGDLALAYPYTSAQAQRLGHNVQHNLVLMVVHGTLHLLGYDHNTPERRATMWEAQADILRELDVPTEIVPALESFDE